MIAKALATFIHGSAGEKAEVSVEIIPRDQHQFELLKELVAKHPVIEQSGGRFVLTVQLVKPYARVEEPSGESRD